MMLKKKIAVFAFSGIMAASMMTPGVTALAADGTDGNNAGNATVSSLLKEEAGDTEKVPPSEITDCAKHEDSFCKFVQVDKYQGMWKEWINVLNQGNTPEELFKSEFKVNGQTYYPEAATYIGEDRIGKDLTQEQYNAIQAAKEKNYVYDFTYTNGMIVSTTAFKPAGQENTIFIKANGYQSLTITVKEIIGGEFEVAGVEIGKPAPQEPGEPGDTPGEPEKPGEPGDKPQEDPGNKKSDKKIAVKAPGKFRVKAMKKGKVKFSWKKVTGAKGYVLEFSKKKTGFKTLKKVTKSKSVVIKSRKLKKGKTYYFAIRAYKKQAGKIYFSKRVITKKVKIKR